MGGIFKNNRFENIVKEGIYSGATTFNPAGTNHISENNFFYQVGNGITLSDATTSIQFPVITFYGQGNRSINDYFHRQLEANTTVNPNFYFNPLVVGTASIENDTVYTQALTSGTNIATTVTRFALIGTEQKIDLEYKLSDSKNLYSRTGKLLINVSQSATPSGNIDTTTTASLGSSIIYLGSKNTGTYEVTAGDAVSGTGIAVGTTVTTVANVTGTITAVTLSIPTTSIVPLGTSTTFTKFVDSYGSLSDYYNFSYTEQWAHSDSDESRFSFIDPVNNYVELTFTNWSPEDLNLEFQIAKSQ
jgi:hypothetical protein